MRGIKAMQYQGDKTLLGEAELRWSFTPRWTLVGFGGVGKAYNDGRKEDSDVIYTKGLGITRTAFPPSNNRGAQQEMGGTP